MHARYGRQSPNRAGAISAAWRLPYPAGRSPSSPSHSSPAPLHQKQSSAAERPDRRVRVGFWRCGVPRRRLEPFCAAFHCATTIASAYVAPPTMNTTCPARPSRLSNAHRKAGRLGATYRLVAARRALAASRVLRVSVCCHCAVPVGDVSLPRL